MTTAELVTPGPARLNRAQVLWRAGGWLLLCWIVHLLAAGISPAPRSRRSALRRDHARDDERAGVRRPAPRRSAAHRQAGALPLDSGGLVPRARPDRVRRAAAVGSLGDGALPGDVLVWRAAFRPRDRRAGCAPSRHDPCDVRAGVCRHLRHALHGLPVRRAGNPVRQRRRRRDRASNTSRSCW